MTPSERIKKTLSKDVDKRTQLDRVLLELYQTKYIGVIHAIRNMYITRLAAIIFDLKQCGFQIENVEPKGTTALYELDTDQWIQLKEEVSA